MRAFFLIMLSCGAMPPPCDVEQELSCTERCLSICENGAWETIRCLPLCGNDSLKAASGVNSCTVTAEPCAQVMTSQLRPQ